MYPICRDWKVHCEEEAGLGRAIVPVYMMVEGTAWVRDCRKPGKGPNSFWHLVLTPARETLIHSWDQSSHDLINSHEVLTSQQCFSGDKISNIQTLGDIFKWCQYETSLFTYCYKSNSLANIDRCNNGNKTRNIFGMYSTCPMLI